MTYFNKRRKFTPASNRKPFHHNQEQVRESISQEITIPEKAEISEPVHEPVKEVPVVTKPKEVVQIKETGKRKSRAERRNDKYDAIASLPRVSIISMIFAPAYSMKKAAASETPTLSIYTCLFLQTCKWLALSMFLSLSLRKTGMLFADEMLFAVKLTCLGLIGEAVVDLALWFIGFLLNEKTSFHQIAAISARACLFEMILFGIAAFLINPMPNMASAVFVTALFLSICLKGYALDLANKVSKSVQLPVAGVILFLYLFFLLHEMPQFYQDVVFALLRLIDPSL
ncbi:MAG: hypothetical protein IKR11_11795 [Solobacterium sp.]|nr:hypothetical protein [Solobacterium sp.]